MSDMLLQYLVVQLCLILFQIDMCFGRIVFEDSLVSGCTTPDGQRGDCERLTKCKTLSQKFKRWDQLRSYLCGFVGTEPKVCCPSTPLPRNSRSFRADLQAAETAAFRHISIPRTIPSCVNNTSQEMPSFLPDDCGSSFSSNSRIIRRQESEKWSWPWMVVIYKDRESGNPYTCGGTLVTEKHVITAVDCVTNNDNVTIHPKHFRVNLGVSDLSNDYDPDTVIFRVDAVHIHEHFDFLTYENDIAVLRFIHSVQFSDNIAPICLPYNSLRNEDFTGKTSTVIGLGKSSYNVHHNNALLEVSVNILDQEECRWIYRRFGSITSTNLCAEYRGSSTDECMVVDSGGTLMTLGNDNRYYLIGVVSYGVECTKSGYPGVYTRVTEVLDWLTPKLVV